MNFLTTVFILVCAAVTSYSVTIDRTQNFYIDWQHDRFVKDGLPYQYVAGGLHYFRVPQQYWKHRIRAAKSAGLNAIQSYVSWSLHEPLRGEYNFQDRLDIVRFIKTVQAEDMTLILRVGPYICGGQDFGGLPGWLLSIPGMQVRTTNTDFMLAVDQWLGVLLGKLEPHLYNNGGPVIMIQVENEYGAFGCDADYMHQLYSLFHKRLGDEVVYFSLDGPGDYICGSINTTQVLTTIDYLEDNDKSAHTEEYFAALKEYQPHGPLVNTEFYTGWLGQWGSRHETRDAAALSRGLEKLLSLNASLALFLWHGGTNFGRGGAFSTTTSYDYDAPMSESGDVRLDKYWAIRKVLENHFPGNTLPVPLPVRKLGGKTVRMTHVGDLVSMVTRDNFLLYNQHPLKFEEMGLYDTMLAYKHTLTTPLHHAQMIVEGVHDRAYVLADNRFVKVLKKEEAVSFTVSATSTITVIVESLGHQAWLSGGLDSMGNEYKGIGNVTANGESLEKWGHYRLDTMTRDSVIYGSHGNASGCHGNSTLHNEHGLLTHGPSLFRGTLELTSSETLDTFLDTTGWGKGVLYVNNQLIGRYWPKAGPQYTLYIPGVYLQEGVNTIEMIEMQSAQRSLTVRLTDKHIINGKANSNVV